MEKKQIPFNKFYKLFNLISIVLVVISFFLLLFKGLNYGVDFKGGRMIELQTKDDQITISNLRQSLMNMNLGDKVFAHIPSELGYGEKAMGNRIPANSDLIFIMQIIYPSLLYQQFFICLRKHLLCFI